MIPNVTRGDRMSGLIGYLVGPGRHNEHTEPHLVEGDAWLMAWHSGDSLDGKGAQEIARHLDAPRRRNGVEVPHGHVWHCSLSLRPDEAPLTDDRWASIAREFVAAMEFDDCQGTREPCRWVAIHHGTSRGGNDHIHIAVDLVRPDGTRADVFRDFSRAQTACRALEKRWGLEQLESVEQRRSTRGVKAGEIEAQARRVARAKWGRRDDVAQGSEPAWDRLDSDRRRLLIQAEMHQAEARRDLADTVRAAAISSDEEASFVRALRRSGVLVHPRFVDGRRDVVAGYSVALRPVAGERPIWYGGGKLAHDLTLTRLRSGWPDTPQSASDAVQEWTRAQDHKATSGARVPMTPQQWRQCSAEVASLTERLRRVPYGDRQVWAATSGQVAGVLASWSQIAENGRGPLGRAAGVVARSAETWEPSGPGLPRSRSTMSGFALAMAGAAAGGQGRIAQVAMIRQIIAMMVALAEVARAQQQARQALAIEASLREELVPLCAGPVVHEAPNVVLEPHEKSTSPEVQAAEQRMRAATTESAMPSQPAEPGLPSVARLAFAQPATEAAHPPHRERQGRQVPPQQQQDRETERG